MDIHKDRVLVLDFGSQYTQLIARSIREIGVYCEIYGCDVADSALRDFAPRAVVLSGGPESVAAAGAPQIPEAVFELGVPVLGICYGMQAMASRLGGQVSAAGVSEFGYARVETGASRLLDGIEDHVGTGGSTSLDVWMSHGDQVTALPEGFSPLAWTQACPLAAMADESRHLYGLQFHPEVTHTRQGKRILERFVCDIAGCRKHWTPSGIIEDAIERICHQVGDQSVLLGLSGGVDSSVLAALLHRAIGDRLVCVFVDNGLLRAGESEQVMAMFAQKQGIRVIQVDASERFLARLSGVQSPEKKRKIIGNTFIEVFDEQATRIGSVPFLAQGTIYPDVIESAASATGKAHVIKSHHNVGGLPEDMTMQLVEPLRELFKDEVRRLGLELGLPYDMVHRHPFPGPGLAVRILGEVHQEYADILRKADSIFIEELYKAELYYKVSQAFAVFLPVKSVGVVGDARRYEYVISLRAVETTDFMTASWARLPYEFLEQVSSRIINEIDKISRVTYDISSKPPATIEWE